MIGGRAADSAALDVTRRGPSQHIIDRITLIFSGCHRWTTYTERLIAHELRGEPARSFEFIVGNKGLTDELAKHADHPMFQRLHIDYQFGDDPDAAYGSIPYDKGAQFLLYLERTVGGLKYWLRALCPSTCLLQTDKLILLLSLHERVCRKIPWTCHYHERLAAALQRVLEPGQFPFLCVSCASLNC